MPKYGRILNEASCAGGSNRSPPRYPQGESKNPAWFWRVSLPYQLESVIMFSVNIPSLKTNVFCIHTMSVNIHFPCTHRKRKIPPPH